MNREGKLATKLGVEQFGRGAAEVVPPGQYRLYGATATEQFVLDDHDSRLPVHLE